MLSYVQPDPQVAHEFNVVRINDKEKEFDTKEGRKRKFIIEFDNNYAAEYCPLVGKPWDDRIKTGKPLLFRIIHRKSFGDEIAPYTLPSSAATTPGSTSPVAGKLINIHGHPAVVALNAASHIYQAHIQAGATEENYGISNMLEDADIIKKWLINAVENPE